MTRPSTTAVILAAGLGTRMRSGRAKVMHLLGGLPLVTWVIRAVRPSVDRVVVVIGHEREAVRAALASEGVHFAVQEHQHGTGHALACALPEVGRPQRLLVLAGDMPGLESETLRDLVAHHETERASATVLTFVAAEPHGYGRIVRDGAGRVASIVEQREATIDIARIAEVNSATYVFETDHVLPLLEKLPPHGNEIYLTDALAALRAEGRVVAAFTAPESQCAGINTQAQLAAAEAGWRARRLAELMDAGVTLVDPASVVVEADVEVGAGTRVGPFVSLEGATRVGSGCEIGALVRLRDVTVHDGAVVRGPFAQDGGEIRA